MQSALPKRKNRKTIHRRCNTLNDLTDDLTILLPRVEEQDRDHYRSHSLVRRKLKPADSLPDRKPILRPSDNETNRSESRSSDAYHSSRSRTDLQSNSSSTRSFSNKNLKKPTLPSPFNSHSRSRSSARKSGERLRRIYPLRNPSSTLNSPTFAMRDSGDSRHSSDSELMDGVLSPARSSPSPTSILRNKRKHFQELPKLKTRPVKSRLIIRLSPTQTSSNSESEPLFWGVTSKKPAQKKSPPSVQSPLTCFPYLSYGSESDCDDDESEKEVVENENPCPPCVLVRESSRLRAFEKKRYNLVQFQARCYGDPVVRRSSDDFTDITDEDEKQTINVFWQKPKATVGSDTIRFKTHIEFTFDLFNKHMKDQYGKENKVEYNYWLFYQQIERFRETAKGIIEGALKSNDALILRECIDEIKAEALSIHLVFLNYDSIHRIRIPVKHLVEEYKIMYERCGPYARLSGGDIQPHEMTQMFDAIQQFIVDKILEDIFIDFCFFIQLNFIVPQANETPRSNTPLMESLGRPQTPV